MKIFQFGDNMTSHQLEIAENFEQAVEREYKLCVEQIRKAMGAVIINVGVDRDIKTDGANGEIDSISIYWQRRLEILADFLLRKNSKFLDELEQKYLKKEKTNE